MATYFGTFLPAVEGGYVVQFPDFPEGLSEGQSLEECVTMGQDALKNVIDAYVRERKPFPKSVSFKEAADWARNEIHENPDCYKQEEPIIQVFVVPNMDMTPVKVTISMPKSTLKNVDAKARQAGMTRSGYLANAAIAYNGN